MSLDLFIVNVAFDAIGRDFRGAPLADLSWVLNSYAITYAALLVPLGSSQFVVRETQTTVQAARPAVNRRRAARGSARGRQAA